MKRIISIFLIFVMAVSLTGCLSDEQFSELLAAIKESSNGTSSEIEDSFDDDFDFDYDLDYDDDDSYESSSKSSSSKTQSKTTSSQKKKPATSSGSINVNDYGNSNGSVADKYTNPNYNPYATIPASAKGKTVRFATWIDHTTTEGANALKNFYKDTGVNVSLFTVPQGTYSSVLQSKIAAGDVPDVFVTNDDVSGFPIMLEFAAPINKVSSVDLNDPIWDQSMLKLGTIGGNIYFLNTLNSPWSGSNLTYYNKALFEENGFKTPAEYYAEGNWTWETAYKVMKEIKGIGAGYEGGYIEDSILTGSAGTSFTKYNYKTNTFSSGIGDSSLTSAYQWYIKCKQAGLMGAQWSNFKQLFREGKLGLVFQGVYGLKKTGHWKDMDVSDVGYTYLPAINQNTPARTSSIWRTYGIVDGAPNADAAGYFIRYWLDYKNYNLDKTFISTEAGNFYYELINKTVEQKYFNFDATTCRYVGTGIWVFTTPVKGASSEAQVSNKIYSVSNVVNQAVQSANKVIQDKIAKNK